MLCPELIQFPTPAHNVSYIESNNWRDINKSKKLKAHLGSLRFARMLSIILPANERSFMEPIAKDLEAGSCSLYLVKQFSFAEMVQKQFLEAFVKRGKFYGISSGTRLDTDDCAAITPDGTIILSLNIETYQRIQLSCSIASRRQNKYVVEINLTTYKARKSLKNEDLAFDMIVRWIPPEAHTASCDTGMVISDQSLVRYLQTTRKMSVEKLSQTGSKFVQLDKTEVPVLQPVGIETQDGTEYCTSEELMEYIGMQLINCDTKSNEYLSSYSPGGKLVEVDKCWIHHRRGMFTPEEIARTIDRLVNIGNDTSIPWIALHVQGFSNMPLNCANSGECGINLDHNIACTIVTGSQGHVMWRMHYGSNGRGSICKLGAI